MIVRLADRREPRGVEFAQPRQRLANDLELTFDREP
jgi:hypothetical protein